MVCRSMSAASLMSYSSDALPLSRSSCGRDAATTCSWLANADVMSLFPSPRVLLSGLRAGHRPERSSSRWWPSRARPSRRPSVCARARPRRCCVASPGNLLTALGADGSVSPSVRLKVRVYLAVLSSPLTQCSSRPGSDAPRLTVGTMEAYRRAFIQTGSLAPLKHVMVRRSPEPAREIALDRRSLTLTPSPRLNWFRPLVDTRRPGSPRDRLACSSWHSAWSTTSTTSTIRTPRGARSQGGGGRHDQGGRCPSRCCGGSHGRETPARGHGRAHRGDQVPRAEIGTLRAGMREAAERLTRRSNLPGSSGSSPGLCNKCIFNLVWFQ